MRSRRPKIWAALLAIVPAFAGCTIKQHVKPVEKATTDEVCIIENQAVRAGFLAEYQRTLEERGYRTRLLAPTAAVGTCPVTSTYLARWSWDLAIYLSYAEIRVFADGAPAGEAVYDSTGGGANLSKFVDAEPKVRELASELFPARR